MYVIMFSEDKVLSPVTYRTFDSAYRDAEDLSKAYPGKEYLVMKVVAAIKTTQTTTITSGRGL